MSVVIDSLFACPGFACSPRPLRRRSCETIAVTLGTCGTWPSSNTLTGAQVKRVLRPTTRERQRMRRLERKLARARRGSNRRTRTKQTISRLRARETDRRKDWAEKASTSIARRFDLIRVEELRIQNMTRSAKGTRENPGRNVRAKAGLNREILRSGWGLLVRRLGEKAPGRVEKIKPHRTSQRCSACGHVDGASRKSQADFRCTTCGYGVAAGIRRFRGGGGCQSRYSRPVKLKKTVSRLGLSWVASRTFSPAAEPAVTSWPSTPSGSRVNTRM
jgi:putative transposase